MPDVRTPQPLARPLATPRVGSFDHFRVPLPKEMARCIS